jgi:hypothetical protein
VPRQKPRNGTWAFQWLFTCKQLPALSKSDPMAQQINFCSFTSKPGAACGVPELPDQWMCS